MTQQDSIQPPPESQQQRWIKYGSNVLLVTIVVIAIAVGVVYLAEVKTTKRFDTTSAGMYSLKPQTINIIKQNTQPIEIVSLYSAKNKNASSTDTTDDSNSDSEADQAGVVSDLLDEYHARGNKITIEAIDPVTNPGKVDDLINNVKAQYNSEIDKYKKFAASVPDKYTNIAKLGSAEADVIQTLPLDQIQSPELMQTVIRAFYSVQEIPHKMKEGQADFAHFLKEKVPDYKKITDSVESSTQYLSEVTGKVIQDFNTAKDDKAVPEAIRKYMADSLPRYAEIKKQADDLLAQEKALGELKLDTLRDALNQKNPILVLGNKEWRVIPYDKVWKLSPRDMRSGGEGTAKPQFAGEQMITTAILSLNQPNKPKVCFVRAGGPPVADESGRLGSLADRLRDYNFDVSEKDLTGMWAMQAMQQQQEAPPEPKDEDIADAVWVVDCMQAQSNPMMGAPPQSIGDKVADHMLKGSHYENGKTVPGGSVFALFPPHGDDLSAALKPWGITAHSDAVAVHQFIKSEGEPDMNIVDSAPHIPFVFIITQWGDHVITQPLSSLMSVLVGAVPITIEHTSGVTATPLLPVPGAPSAPPSWGETDFSSVETDPKYDKVTDLAAPLYAGAAAEKAGARLVCYGSEQAMFGTSGMSRNNLVDMVDQDLYDKKKIIAPQFPGTAEFFMNSIFWLSHQEPMIAISPSAMNVSRIKDMSPGLLRFWRVGVLLIGLPGLVLLAGAGVYFRRQD